MTIEDLTVIASILNLILFLQGLLVAIFCCFLNIDVRKHLLRRWSECRRKWRISRHFELRKFSTLKNTSMLGNQFFLISKKKTIFCVRRLRLSRLFLNQETSFWRSTYYTESIPIFNSKRKCRLFVEINFCSFFSTILIFKSFIYWKNAKWRIFKKFLCSRRTIIFSYKWRTNSPEKNSMVALAV